MDSARPGRRPVYSQVHSSATSQIASEYMDDSPSGGGYPARSLPRPAPASHQRPDMFQRISSRDHTYGQTDLLPGSWQPSPSPSPSPGRRPVNGTVLPDAMPSAASWRHESPSPSPMARRPVVAPNNYPYDSAPSYHSNVVNHGIVDESQDTFSNQLTDEDIYNHRTSGTDEYYPLTQYPVNGDVPFEGITGQGYEASLSNMSQGPGQHPQEYLDDQPLIKVPPERQPRRYKTVKRVPLYDGNLVLDCPIPNKMLNTLGMKQDREFTHMRYTAATCDPNDFKAERFTLRQVLYEQPRHTELFIVITMYNENEILFARTMHGVMKNIKHLCTRERSRIWGREGWRKVVVCIVADGRAKIHPRTLAVLAAMGVYQDGVAKNVVNGKPVTAHIYEYTTQITVDADLRFQSSGTVPVQIIFCLKEKNQKKINSHRWFFQAFGSVLNPNICVLLDTGTRPGGTSIYHLWKAFDLNSNVAGACGEIVAMKGKGGVQLLNPLVAAQNFEYKMSNILDKPLESVFGFISVLPGAFSAYRYLALQNDGKGTGPLASYFKGETMHGADAGIFDANMYLAEDRILCFELVAKRQCAWVLHYVKSAYAETDVPDKLDELISQRRRWLNGSFFAALYSISHMFKIFSTDHGCFRKIAFLFEFFYMTLNMIFSWFALANFFLIFVILTSSMGDPASDFAPGYILFQVFEYIYLALLIMCFVL